MMEEKQMIPFVVFESISSRYERVVKHLITAIIIIVILLFASNAIWVYEWTQYDYSSEESVDIDAKDGTANYIGNDGDITNGENSGHENPKASSEK